MHGQLKARLFFLCVIVLGRVLILSFRFSSLLGFYVGFEASLIPTLAIIIIWGAQPERLLAGMYLMMYTISASLPLLVSLLLFHRANGRSYIYFEYR